MVKGMNHITFAVSNVERAFRFYSDILGLKPVAKWYGGAYLTAGGFWIALNLDAKVETAKRPDYSHIAFSCDGSDFQQLKEKLLEYGCPEWSENTSEGESFYFKDPDGHKLEVHVGNLESRLKEMKGNHWAEFEFY
jgi:catechol 2,3-dioxygenase-like lactoylglutathione lyase family enzyme